MSADARRDGPLHVFLVAGEPSGDQLGGRLMAALRTQRKGAVRFSGVGGPAMAAEGLGSLYPMEELTALGILPVVASLPRILRRLRETVAAIVAARPDVLILIDSPDFTHRVARRVRRALPALAIIKYVAPTVWAWRPGRARAMRPDFDHVLALLPFEPAVMQRLGGPPTTYVGHPLLERLAELQPTAADLAAREREPPLVLLLPGSRPGELARLGAIFGDAAGRVAKAHAVEFVLPTPVSLAAQVQAAIASWPVQPRVVTAEADKFAAFRRARAALAASGTVTLELALARVPMVTAYRVGLLDALLARALLVVDTPILVNIALRERAVPEFLQHACRPDALTATLLPLLTNGPERAAQLAAFTRLEAMMRVDEAPSVRAARVVMECMR